MDLIISHAGCLDGWTAAYIAKKRYPEAEIVLLNHGIDPEPIIAQCTGKDVLMLDYSLRTREQNDRLNFGAKSFHIYDHHKSAQAVLEGADYATFDMKRSGAGLAWDYLFGEDGHISCPLFVNGVPTGETLESEDFPRPWWVNHVEDTDLWNWALPNSQEIDAYLRVQERSVEAWDKAIEMNAEGARKLGVGVRQYMEYYTRCVITEAQTGILSFGAADYRTAVLNIPYAGVSEAGNALVRHDRHDIALMWFERGDGVVQFSLRSNRDGLNVDVSQIASYFGGGGHRNAAGFQMTLLQSRAFIDDILSRGAEVQKWGSKEVSTQVPRSPGGCA